MENSSALTKVHPIVKWAGGKGQIVNEIVARYPKDLGNDIDKYAEPFIGGGAVLFDVLSNYKMREVYISDINPELINMYKSVRAHVDALLEMLHVFEEKYLARDTASRKEFFYEKRARYNELINDGTSKDSIESAALFIFLNHTCFNGLYRVNKKGLFNVPSGAYKNPKICDEENLRKISSLLQNVEMVCADYKKSANFIDDKTFAYFDPPYRPLNQTSSFTNYTAGGFDDNAQKELADFVQKLINKGAHVLLSNSDPKNENQNDDFFDELYGRQIIHRIAASRMINSKANGRGKIIL